MLKELHSIIESASPAALAKEFAKLHGGEEGKVIWTDLDSEIQNFLVHKGLRGSKLEQARDKINAHLEKLSHKE